MKKFIAVQLFIFGFIFLLFAAPVQAQEKIDLYFFYGDGCPHCAKEEKFLNKLMQENKNIQIHLFEVWRNSDNADILERISEELGVTIRGIPVLVISDQVITGYHSDEVTGKKIEELIAQYQAEGCSDIVAPLLGRVPVNATCIHMCEPDDTECQHDCGCSADEASSEKDQQTIQKM